VPHPPPKLIRKVIRICAQDSPNVRRAEWEIANGLPPTGMKADGSGEIVPGVLSWAEYRMRRKILDPIQQCIALDARFYQGAELLLYPPEWLNLAERRYEALRTVRRVCKGIGMDPAEGGDSTAMCAVDEYGIIELVARKTPNTDDIPRELMAFMVKHKMTDKADRVCIDRGGGKQHADRLRALGYRVRTVAFGESVQEDPKSSKDSVRTKVDQRESRYEYKTRRAQMFGELSELLDPGIAEGGPRLAIPRTETVLRQEMAPIPKTYDEEGRLTLIPKHAKPGDKNPDGTPKDKRKCLVGLIGHSPDRLDSFALAVHAMLHEAPIVRVGAASWGVG
jgi:hypothetical protein